MHQNGSAALQHLVSKPQRWILAGILAAVILVIDSLALATAVRVLGRRRRSCGVLIGGGLLIAGSVSNVLDGLGLHHWTAPGSVRGAVDFLPVTQRAFSPFLKSASNVADPGHRRRGNRARLLGREVASRPTHSRLPRPGLGARTPVRLCSASPHGPSTRWHRIARRARLRWRNRPVPCSLLGRFHAGCSSDTCLQQNGLTIAIRLDNRNAHIGHIDTEGARCTRCPVASGRYLGDLPTGTAHLIGYATYDTLRRKGKRVTEDDVRVLALQRHRQECAYLPEHCPFTDMDPAERFASEDVEHVKQLYDIRDEN